jgi:hypothetical protein
LETNILKKIKTVRREPRGPTLGEASWRAPRDAFWLTQSKSKFKKNWRQIFKTIQNPSPRAMRAGSRQRTPLHRELTLGKDYFHQILFKNIKQIQNFAKT